ncbi:bifunctional 3,4-dihydroxy-2-butanone-4-phosphate synthase/GTP cyclohydrolase II [Radiobacillus kanasensis]|uniref:bifunctional 3,4-dihydroxy-2-butanone-4-phosphate synthase/GTP cyclohydrolase II n=1 Tax=Radiobacillus kanasensis TaxID=2844358 RepID=UPI001E60689E|nr:bifunctional 3,4-dihydroxy-2-butanone-4-phosphate synthase/GTP cyclohydrolase II [Radiobacillus kanasensis]UFU00306.1 bifunctional 3,4-dihydroxy-2-butanone-4-phosphate synthase/GTP cyclohydrolase II [Radiobacillus kanasensis]
MFQTIEKVIQELQEGKMIIVVDDEDRENEGDFVVLAEHATPEVINFMVSEGKGLVCTPMDQTTAMRLKLHPMVSENTDSHQTAFTVSVDYKTTHTGISAFERSLTIQKMLDSETASEDFKRPGHVFPLIAKEMGVLERPGHTEAAVDLARLAGSDPVGVICEIMNDDGTMARLPQLVEIGEKHGLSIITIKDLIAYRKRHDALIMKEEEILLPTKYGDFKLAAYVDRLNGKEHLALFKGEFQADESTLVRIHSECLTGDVFGSHRCDCGPQLEKALAQIEAEGKGVLVYMRQEGRGIGLLNKLKAYKLQQDGFDTVEANHQLGFAEDERDYAVSAQILKDLGIKKLRLLTNNPRKIAGLKEYGLEVIKREEIEIPVNKNNEFYLKTKQEKLDHLLHF